MLILEFNSGKITLLSICHIFTTVYCPNKHGHKQNNASLPKDGHVPVPRTYDHVTLHSKKDFAKVIKLRILRWENHLGLPWWIECNHKGAYKREARGSMSERGDMTMETEIGVVHFENGHELRSSSSL